MNKKKAISILKNQLSKLNSLPENQESSWIMETETYIDSFFGSDSIQHSYIHYFSFKEINSSLDISNYSKSKDQLKTEMKTFLNDAINTIDNIGLKKDPVDNWFSKLPNWAINLGLPALCFISFSAGILFTNNNNAELRNENSELKEQLLLISSDTIADKHKNLSDKPK